MEYYTLFPDSWLSQIQTEKNPYFHDINQVLYQLLRMAEAAIEDF